MTVGAGAGHWLYRDSPSVVHRLPAEVKIVVLVVFVLAVVATPREQYWHFGGFVLILLAVWRAARIPVRWILPRMLIEAPFLVLAVLLPFAEGVNASRWQDCRCRPWVWSPPGESSSRELWGSRRH